MALSLLSTTPSGKYSGSKTVLGLGIHMELTLKSTTTFDFEMTGAETISCPNEAYTYDGKTGVTLPNMDKPGDCVHDKLDGTPASLGSIVYDNVNDKVVVQAKYAFVTLSVELTHESPSAPMSFALMGPQTLTALETASWFDAFQKRYARAYDSEEERAMRFRAFVANLETISARNADGELGFHFITKFADLTPEEFRSKHLGYTHRPDLLFATEEEDIEANATATSVDWRKSKLVTPVKDQGQCGSCWAFSATEQIETAVAVATGKLLELSPQQITSCDKVDDGCDGGNTESAYQYVKKAGGIEASSSYPYASGARGKTGKCRSDKAEFVAKIGGFSSVSKRASSEKKMVAKIQHTPISVCVDAEAWQTYHSGVIGRSCGKDLDHCVQAVGYQAAGSNGKKPYWIVRNSWNTDWGVDGFIYVQAGINACGIATDATVVTGASLE